MSNWASFSDFIHMNGHGYYVWCSYAAFAIGALFLFAVRNRIAAKL